MQLIIKETLAKTTEQICYKLDTETEVIHDKLRSYRINYLPERYDENLLLPTKLTLEQNKEVMKKLNLIQ